MSYNPKGWAGLGGARPSIAAFLFVGPTPGLADAANARKKKLAAAVGMREDEPLADATVLVKLRKVRVELVSYLFFFLLTGISVLKERSTNRDLSAPFFGICIPIFVILHCRRNK